MCFPCVPTSWVSTTYSLGGPGSISKPLLLLARTAGLRSRVLSRVEVNIQVLVVRSLVFVTIKVMDQGIMKDIDMVCTREELQLLIASVGDMVKECARTMKLAES